MTLRYAVLLLCAMSALGETRKPDRTISDVGGRVYSVAYSPDGALVAAGGEDKRVRIWDANTGMLKLAMGGQTGSIWAVAFSLDGKSVASASLDGTIRILNLGSGKFERGVLERSLDAAGARGVAFQPGSEPILAMSAQDRVIFWNFVTGQRLKTLDRGGVKIGPLAFRPDGKVLVSGGSDGSIRLWDTATGAFIRNADAGSPVMSVAASAAHVAAGCEDGKVKLLSFDGQESELSGTNTAVYAVALSADGAQLAAAGNNHTIDVWDVKSGKLLMSFEGHTQEALAVAFSPNGRSIVSGGADGTIRYWTQ